MHLRTHAAIVVGVTYFANISGKKTDLRNLVSLLIRGPSCVKKATQKTRDTAPLRVLQCSRGSSNVSLILTIHSIIERNKGED